MSGEFVLACWFLGMVCGGGFLLVLIWMDRRKRRARDVPGEKR